MKLYQLISVLTIATLGCKSPKVEEAVKECPDPALDKSLVAAWVQTYPFYDRLNPDLDSYLRVDLVNKREGGYIDICTLGESWDSNSIFDMERKVLKGLKEKTEFKFSYNRPIGSRGGFGWKCYEYSRDDFEERWTMHDAITTGKNLEHQFGIDFWGPYYEFVEDKK